MPFCRRCDVVQIGH